MGANWLYDLIAMRIAQSGVENTPKRAIWDFQGAVITDDPAGNRKLLSVSVPPDVNITETFRLSGVITPPQITATQNDYSPSGIADATTLRLSTDARRQLSSIVGGTAGRVLRIDNIGSFPLVILPNAGGTAANRIIVPTSGLSEYDILPNESVWLVYDGVSLRWRMMVLRSEVFGRFTISSAPNADVGDYGRFGAAWIRLAPSVAFARIGGIDAQGTDREEVLITNVASANIVALQHEDSTATAARRFALPWNQHIIMPGDSVRLIYDGTSTRYRLSGEIYGRPARRGADLTDANQTLQTSGGVEYQLPWATLTTTRTKTLGVTGPPTTGTEVVIRRFDRTANTMPIANGGGGGGTPFTFPASTAGELRIIYDGTNWVNPRFSPYA
jgi:hypothetical protein